MKLTFCVILLIILKANSQNFSDELTTIKSKNQECLNVGKHMFDCSVKYYQESDSLLNVVYDRIKSNLRSEEKNDLVNSQLAWIKLRNLEFKKINSKNTDLGNGLDDKMIKNQEKANFTSKRIQFLINKFLKTESK